MATLDDIRHALASQIDTIVYPNGDSAQPIVAVPGSIKITPGWPAPFDLSLKKLAYPPDGIGNTIIAVQDINNHDVTRFERKQYLVSKGVPTLSWALSANDTILTLSGAVSSSPQNVAIIVNGKQDYVYQTTPTDTIATVIAALAALMPSSLDVDADENSLYFPNALSVIGRVGSFSRYVTLTGQYRATVCVAIFCGDDGVRNSLVFQIKPVLDQLTRFTLPDGTVANMATGREVSVTDMEGMGVVSTRLIYMVDYSSAETMLVPQAIVFRSILSDAGGVISTTEA